MKGRLFSVLLFIAVAAGHTVLSNLTIAGRTTKECIRPFMNWDGQTAPGFPIADGKFPNGVMGINYTCGWTDAPRSGAALPSTRACDVAAGSTIRASWWHGALSTEDPAVDSYIHNSHHGPFTVYMAKWDQSGGLPTGAAWFKIHESAVLKDHREFWNMEWVSPHGLNQNNGGLDFVVPRQLAPGKYLMRFEILALHDTIKQPYVHCADITVTGTGTVQPNQLISIPGTMKLSDPGFAYNMYQMDGNRPAYIIPGPRPYDFTVAATTQATTARPSSNAASTTVRSTQATTAQPSTQGTTVRSNEEGNSAAMFTISIALTCVAMLFV